MIRTLIHLLRKFRISVISILTESSKTKAKISMFSQFKMSILPRYSKTRIKFNKKFITILDPNVTREVINEIFNLNVYNFDSISKNPKILDCGSNIGLSIIYFKILYPNSEITGFEPDPLVFSILKDNLEKFNFQNIVLLNKAVWNKDEILNFMTSKSFGGKVIDKAIGKETESIQIEAVDINNYCSEKVDLLKIDIEGSEFEVLKSLESKLINIKCIILEYHDRDQKQLIEILNILERNNFDFIIQSPIFKHFRIKEYFKKLSVFNYVLLIKGINKNF